jgi:hypothetical protein
MGEAVCRTIKYQTKELRQFMDREELAQYVPHILKSLKSKNI